MNVLTKKLKTQKSMYKCEKEKNTLHSGFSKINRVCEATQDSPTKKKKEKDNCYWVGISSVELLYKNIVESHYLVYNMELTSW